MARKSQNLDSPLIKPDVWKRFVETSIKRAREPQFLANELLEAVADSETGTIERALSALARGERDGVYYIPVSAGVWKEFSERLNEIGNDPHLFIKKMIELVCARFNVDSRSLCLRLFEAYNTLNGRAGIESVPARDDEADARQEAFREQNREREEREKKQAERDGTKKLDAWYSNQVAQARKLLREHKRKTRSRRKAA